MSTYFRILKAIIRENKKQTAFCFGIMLVMSVLQVAIPLAMKGMVAKIEEMPSVSLFILRDISSMESGFSPSEQDIILHPQRCAV